MQKYLINCKNIEGIIMNLYVWGTGRLVGKVIGKYVQLDMVDGFIDSNKKQMSIWERK